MVATTNQEPIELVMTPGSESDMRAFKRFELALPDESVIYTDKAYTDIDSRSHSKRFSAEDYAVYPRLQHQFSHLRSCCQIGWLQESIYGASLLEKVDPP